MSVLETSRPKDILTFLKAITFGPTYTLPLLINNISNLQLRFDAGGRTESVASLDVI